MSGNLEKIWAAIMVGVCAAACWAEQQAVVLDRDGATVALEPYAPNIIRVTLSTIKDSAVSAPGYGFLATPSARGWVEQKDNAADVYRSPRLVVSVAINKAQPRSATQSDISKYFHGSAPPVHITVSTSGGKNLVELTSWWMAVPNYKDDNAGILHYRRLSDPPFFV